MDNEYADKLERARQHVAKIKGFHRHLAIFVVVNAVMLLAKGKPSLFFFEEALSYPGAMDWVYWNLLIWLLFIVIHAFLVFGKVPVMLRRWENRQMKKFIQEEEGENP